MRKCNDEDGMRLWRGSNKMTPQFVCSEEVDNIVTTWTDWKPSIISNSSTFFHHHWTCHFPFHLLLITPLPIRFICLPFLGPGTLSTLLILPSPPPCLPSLRLARFAFLPVLVFLPPTLPRCMWRSITSQLSQVLPFYLYWICCCPCNFSLLPFPPLAFVSILLPSPSCHIPSSIVLPC